MTNEIVVRDEPQTAAQIKSQVQLIQQVMAAVMKEGTHYGKIPGTDKPTLFKAGAEKILSTFRIGVEPIVVDLSTADEAKFRVMTRGFLVADGRTVGTGLGEASSNEEKYKWRKAICQEEYDATPEDRRREKFGKYEGRVTRSLQVRTNPADVANTVLKMAKKRSQIDLTLTATAASDVFAQDLEDLADNGVDVGNGEKKKPISMPTATSDGGQAHTKPDQSQSADDRPTTIGPVESVSEKSGTNARGPYVKYGVKVNGEWHGTFDTDHGKIAQQAKADGAQVSIVYAQDGKYRNIVEIRALAEG